MIINESAGYMSAQYIGIKLTKFMDLGALQRIYVLFQSSVTVTVFFESTKKQTKKYICKIRKKCFVQAISC